MKFLKYALIVLFSVGIMSCGSSGGDDEEKEDTVAPTLTITSPTTSTKVAAGANLSVNFTAADNVALASYTVTVSYTGAKSVKTVQEFSFNSISDTDAAGNALPSISGASKIISFNIAVTDIAKPGAYKLSVTVKDTAGKSTTKDISFEIE
ncbi:DUF4625 domain-containing protein [Labilibaculum antarcticum]|uniref:DUF4625 domain-containing protein n=1 Tax=Labilibaculum antarcticum TaxID=1717717 RepID=A0A1Y1CHJ9_9BACT|nr:DUF4625 domain-containing protein [Labilibaculum antarcticum]BAX79859.1 hypothetical protein ALGA_1480 [Labilibaculum antarcticum]